MVGIALTPEQIRTAPPDVRRWLQQELVKTFGLRPDQSEAPEAQPRHEHLVACTVDEAASILRLIQGMLPVVNVFFELGRHAANLPDEGLAAFRLTDMLHHTRLQNLDQIIDCLRIINEAVQQVRSDPDATLYALDQYGDCYVAAQTQQSILRLWLQVVGGQVGRGASAGDEGPTANLAGAPGRPASAPGDNAQQPSPADAQGLENTGPFVRQAVA
ncbi:MAG: hypothetical protein JO289_21290 [Xanthobacteraceae bacterium]|nr:hypothetical protein [Xanthobacteraceae bacterium]